MKKLKVLVVEDDQTTAFMIESQLKDMDYEVSGIASNYEEAMKSTKQDQPDLIIMNIVLRGEKNGVETALEIYKTAEIPIVFISTPANEMLVKEAKFIQNAVFLNKPFDAFKLEQTIKYVQEEFLKRTPEHIEAERIKALHRYEILDSPEEGSFDRITSLAALIFKVPIALVSIVDKDRIWFKSRYGFDEKQISRKPDICTSAFLSDEFYHIGDIKKDPRSLVNPLIAYDAGFHFYASAPLLTKEGYNLGTLCIIDRQAREITGEEKKTLSELAAIVMDEMELRLASRRAYRLQREFLSTAVHDLKNPLAGILGLADLIKRKMEDQEAVREFTTYIKRSGEKMLTIIDELMETALIELNNIKLQLTSVNLADVAREVVEANQPQAHKKNQSLKLNIQARPVIQADPAKISEVMDNLVSNAIKYTPNDKSIEINVNALSGKACFAVKDQGVGLTEKDKEKIFQKFTRLSSKPTGGESSTGLGLSIAKSLVELHGGKIKAESEGENKGCTFEVELPVAS